MSLFMSFSSLAEISGNSSSFFIFLLPVATPITDGFDDDELVLPEEPEPPVDDEADDTEEDLFGLTITEPPERLLNEEVVSGTERSRNISPPRIFCISLASSGSIGPIFCLT